MTKEKRRVRKYRRRPSKFDNKPVEGQIRRGEWHWSYTVMLIGMFGGGTSMAFVTKYTLVELGVLWRYIIFFCVIFLVLPYRWYRDTLKLERLEVVLLNVLGVGPAIMGILMWLNFLILTERSVNTYVVAERENIGIMLSPADIKLKFENNELEEEPGLRIFDTYIYPEALRADSVRYDMGRGLLGYKVVRRIDFLE